MALWLQWLFGYSGSLVTVALWLVGYSGSLVTVGYSGSLVTVALWLQWLYGYSGSLVTVALWLQWLFLWVQCETTGVSPLSDRSCTRVIYERIAYSYTEGTAPPSHGVASGHPYSW